jgi:hypothetical protein
MSLINDALKQARKTPPRNLPTTVPPPRPAADDPSFFPSWLLPSLVVFLIVAAIFFIGWAVAHRNVRALVAEPESAGSSTQEVAAFSLPVSKPRPVEPPPINPADAPKLQGIFYSPTAPSAIVDGKTVRPGDKFGAYRVKAISKYTVTLIGPDKREFQLGMGN